MIAYGTSVQGKSHIERGVVCQDSSELHELAGGLYIGIVSDGVGSASHSDIGSKIAVESLYEFCREKICAGMSYEVMQDVLYAGYEYAFEKVNQYVLEQEHRIEDYDATLSSAIYDGRTVVFGHAGDGGILVRCCDGQIKPITVRQKGADGVSVRPLRAGNRSWDFGICEESVAAVLLLTDGMLDGVFQPILVNLPSSQMELARGNFKQDNVYISAAELFMNPKSVFLNRNIKNPAEFMQYIVQGNFEKTDLDIFLQCMKENYIELLGVQKADWICRGISKLFYAIGAIINVTDDKSVVCIINEAARVTPQNLSYYQEPNWEWRQNCYNALLYNQEMPPVPQDDPMSGIPLAELMEYIPSTPAPSEEPVRARVETTATQHPSQNRNRENVSRKFRVDPKKINKPQEEGKPAKRSKSKEKKIIIVAVGIIALLVVVVIVLAIALISSKNKKETSVPDTPIRTERSIETPVPATPIPTLKETPKNRELPSPTPEDVPSSIPSSTDGNLQDNEIKSGVHSKEDKNTPDSGNNSEGDNHFENKNNDSENSGNAGETAKTDEQMKDIIHIMNEIDDDKKIVILKNI